MTGIFDWSTTDASNTSVGDVSIAEGMARASVNNGMRAIMGDMTQFLYDIGGSVATTGSLNAYAVTLNSVPTTLANNLFFCVKFNHTNTGASTINVNTLGNVDLKKKVAGSATALASGEAPSGGIGIISYVSADSAYILHNPYQASASTILTTRGDLIRRGASAPERVGLGTTGQVLSSDGTDAVWGAGVNSILTTRGDLIRRGASAGERVALGASGKVLQSDGTDAVWGPIVSGTVWTPTLTDTTNVALSTEFESKYHRIDTIVSGTIKAEVTPTAAAPTATVMGISLPVASNFASADDAIGGAFSPTGSQIGNIVANTTSDVMELQFNATTTSLARWNIFFSYKII